MQRVASAEIESARDLFEFLKGQSNPAELLVAADESGLEPGEVLGDDGAYERACGIVPGGITK